MYEFWYDYIKPKYVQKGKFVIWIQTVFFRTWKRDDYYKDTAKYVETRFDTSNYELNRPLPKGKNKEVIGVMKEELGWKSWDNLSNK